MVYIYTIYSYTKYFYMHKNEEAKQQQKSKIRRRYKIDFGGFPKLKFVFVFGQKPTTNNRHDKKRHNITTLRH